MHVSQANGPLPNQLPLVTLARSKHHRLEKKQRWLSFGFTLELQGPTFQDSFRVNSWSEWYNNQPKGFQVQLGTGRDDRFHDISQLDEAAQTKAAVQ